LAAFFCAANFFWFFSRAISRWLPPDITNNSSVGSVKGSIFGGIFAVCGGNQR
jgi:hypothetical protein